MLRHRRCLWGHCLYVSALKLDEGKLFIVTTAHRHHTAISDYAHRWGIEMLVGIFKTRGFCLESTHLQDLERLSRLFALLMLALCWVFRTGQWLNQLKPLKLKKHGRRTKSILRHGFDHLRALSSISTREQMTSSKCYLFCPVLRVLPTLVIVMGDMGLAINESAQLNHKVLIDHSHCQ